MNGKKTYLAAAGMVHAWPVKGILPGQSRFRWPARSQIEPLRSHSSVDRRVFLQSSAYSLPPSSRDPS